jgi:hypothetical protein
MMRTREYIKGEIQTILGHIEQEDWSLEDIAKDLRDAADDATDLAKGE